MNLSATPKVRYSKIERALFDLLPRGGKKINSRDLIIKYYGANHPYHGRTIVTGAVRSLAKKAQFNGEKFILMRSNPQGPKPIEYWLKRK